MAADLNGGLLKLGFSTGSTMQSEFKMRPDYATGTVFAAERKDVPTFESLWFEPGRETSVFVSLAVRKHTGIEIDLDELQCNLFNTTCALALDNLKALYHQLIH